MNEHAAREISHDDEKQKSFEEEVFLHSAKMKNFPTSSAISATFFFIFIFFNQKNVSFYLCFPISTTAITVCCVQNVGKKRFFFMHLCMHKICLVAYNIYSFLFIALTMSLESLRGENLSIFISFDIIWIFFSCFVYFCI